MARNVEDLVREFTLDLRLKGYADRTVREYARLVRTCFADGLEPSEITRHDVVRLLDAADTDSKKRWRWMALRSFCRFLVDEDLLDRDPTQKISMPKEKRRPQPILSDDDLEAMLATCSSKRFEDLRDRALLLTLASTGCRRVELAAILVSDLNIEVGSVMIRSAKGGMPRMSYLDTDTRRALLRYLRGARTDEALWTSSSGEPLSADAVSQVIKRRAARAGVKVTPHMFRRRLAAAWLMNGGSQVGLMAAAGWKNPAMPAMYAASAAEEIARTEHERMSGKRLRFNKKRT